MVTTKWDQTAQSPHSSHVRLPHPWRYQKHLRPPNRLQNWLGICGCHLRRYNSSLQRHNQVTGARTAIDPCGPRASESSCSTFQLVTCQGDDRYSLSSSCIWYIRNVTGLPVQHIGFCGQVLDTLVDASVFCERRTCFLQATQQHLFIVPYTESCRQNDKFSG